jgi:hypothetical protein
MAMLKTLYKRRHRSRLTRSVIPQGRVSGLDRW